MKRLMRAIVAVAATAFIPGAARAAIEVTIEQVGSDVVVNASGSLDLAGLTSQGSYKLSRYVRGNVGYVGLGDAGNVIGYSGLTGPSSFGTGAITTYSSSSGDLFAMNGGGFGSPYVFLPVGYVSGTEIDSTATFLDLTLALLGVTPGQYVYSSRLDTVTIDIREPETALPEPTTWAMMLLGFGAIGFAMRRVSRETPALPHLA